MSSAVSLGPGIDYIEMHGVVTRGQEEFLFVLNQLELLSKIMIFKTLTTIGDRDRGGAEA